MQVGVSVLTGKQSTPSPLRAPAGTKAAFARGMDTVRYVEIGLWVLNVIIYASCLWLWIRPEPDESFPKGSRREAPRTPSPGIWPTAYDS